MRTLKARYDLVRYRSVRRETVPEYFARTGGSGRGRYETIHAESVAVNPLPRNVAARSQLPDDRGWWGFSFRDVPARTSAETFVATVPDCIVSWYRDPLRAHDFFPAILTRDGTALEMREIRFRPGHAEVLRQSGRPIRVRQATWILERVYHNHSHWLTAHLPKVLLLEERGELEHVLLPRDPTPVMVESLRMVGVDPDGLPRFDPARPLEIEALTILGTDRFRPELLHAVAHAYGAPGAPLPWRRIFVSRAGARRRRLLDEDEIWPILERAGFQRIRMEELPFGRQVDLMRETAVLVAPHGAGLTNMLFCPPGADVIEIADLGFPNPNFYALASALGHRYWLLAAQSCGSCHPLEKDLRIGAADVRQVLEQLSVDRP